MREVVVKEYDALAISLSELCILFHSDMGLC